MTIPQTPAAFLQSLRMRARAMPSGSAILVVEGSTDRSVLLPFTSESTIIVVSRGKDRLLPAYEQLEANLRSSVLFVLDCDGNTPAHLKGREDLVLSTNRDLESDLLFELDVLQRVVLEVLADRVESLRSARAAAGVLLAVAADYATALGVVQDAARRLRFAVRIVDPLTGQKRGLRPSDLAGVNEALRGGVLADCYEIARGAALLLGWSESQLQHIESEIQRGEREGCARHEALACLPCRRMRHCNGHSLVDALSRAFLALEGRDMPPAELDRLLRVASTGVVVDHWPVLARARHWQQARGITALS